jgi:hypothetical protein
MIEPLGKDAVLPPGTAGTIENVDVTGELPQAAWHLEIPEAIPTGRFAAEQPDPTRPLTGYVDGSLTVTTALRDENFGTMFTLYNTTDGSLRGSLRVPYRYDVMSDEQFIYILDQGAGDSQATVAFIDGTGSIAACFAASDHTGTQVDLTRQAGHVIADSGQLFVLNTATSPTRLERLTPGTIDMWEPNIAIDRLLAAHGDTTTDLVAAAENGPDGTTLELFQITSDSVEHVNSLPVADLFGADVPQWLTDINTAYIGADIDPLAGADIDVTRVDIINNDTDNLAAVTIHSNGMLEADHVVVVDLANSVPLWRTWLATTTWTTDLYAITGRHIAASYLPNGTSEATHTFLVEPATGNLLSNNDTAPDIGSLSKSSMTYSAHRSERDDGTAMVVYSDGKQWGAIVANNATATPLAVSNQIIAAFIETGGKRYLSAHPVGEDDSGGNGSNGETCPNCQP